MALSAFGFVELLLCGAHLSALAWALLVARALARLAPPLPSPSPSPNCWLLRPSAWLACVVRVVGGGPRGRAGLERERERTFVV